MIPLKFIIEYQRICKEEFGATVSDAVAEDEIIRLLNLWKLCAENRTTKYHE